ncbi:hypothetical protein [Polyangium spumosum]|uniref:Uncharacterized protein n=1 Tax=Polyangium spumosum TaxID=889282 RepID=A0A6N7Q8A9_9BACT|nr:hypothetical protein [Polyangium spumosum]MRG97101.1 hypothetical protein [Polyangium spumosum]
MRFTFLMIAVLTLTSCSRTEPTEVTLERNKVARVNGCNALVTQVYIKPDAAWFKWACGVPESAPNWWGEGFEPPASTLLEGDCVRIDQTYYCVKDINPEDMSVTLVATYKPIDSSYDHLRPLR